MPGTRPRTLLAVLCGIALLTACCSKERQSRDDEAPSGPAAAAPGEAAPKGPGGGARKVDAPHVRLAALADWEAVLKPCGCVAELQRGGIERIGRWVKTHRADDPSLLLVHAGTLLTEHEPPSAAQASSRAARVETFLAGLERLGPAAVALSSADLERGGTAVRAKLADAPWPLLAVGFGGELAVKPHVLVKTASGLSVGITAIDPASAPDREARHALVAAQRDAMRKAGASVVVVLSNLGLRGSRKLARAVDGIDTIVVGDLPERIDPVRELEVESGKVLLIPNRHGAWFASLVLVPQGLGPTEPWRDATPWILGASEARAARIKLLGDELQGLEGDQRSLATRAALPQMRAELAALRRRQEQARAVANQPLPPGRLLAFEAVGLPWSAPVDEALAKLVSAYDDRAATLGSAAARDPKPAQDGKPSYVGGDVCVGCHQDASAFARDNPHAHAWQTLVDAKKTRDLDCVGCHVTGWLEPGGSAFANLDRFHNVTCESCHGPGSDHVAAAGQGPIVRKPTADACVACHNHEHSPRFDFATYRQRIVVPGHGKPLAGRTP